MNTTKDEIILVAHGSSQPGAWSAPYIDTITKSGQSLTFNDAKAYIKTGIGATFSGTSFGQFAALSDKDCLSLFGKPVDNSAEIQDTDLRLGGTMTRSAQ